MDYERKETMISIEMDRDMPDSCLECPLKYKDGHGTYRCPVSRKYVCGAQIRNNIVSEFTNSRPSWCELRNNNELSGRLHFRTQLCDGNVHLLSIDAIIHNVRERYEKQRMMLKKLANNPILSEEYRQLLWMQIYNINQLESRYRDDLIGAGLIKPQKEKDDE